MSKFNRLLAESTKNHRGENQVRSEVPKTLHAHATPLSVQEVDLPKVEQLPVIEQEKSTDLSKNNTFAKNIAFVVVGLMLLITIGGFIVGSLTFSSRTSAWSYEKDALTDEVRDLKTGELIREIPLNTIFTEENIARYEKGDGFTVELITKNNPAKDYATTSEKFGIEAFSRYQKEGAQLRRNDIADAEKKLRRGITLFFEHTPVHRTLEVYVDNTGGIDDALRQKFRSSIVDGFGLKKILDQGDKVSIMVSFVSDLPSLPEGRCPEVLIDSSAKFEEGLAAAATCLADQDQRDKSEIANGLFNQLRENSNRINRYVMIITDGIENSPLLEGYTDEGFATLKTAAEGDGAAFDKLMGSVMPIPDLKNVYHVGLYGPPPDPAHFERSVVALRAWRGLFIRAMTKSIKASASETITDDEAKQKALKRIDEPHV